MMWIMIYAILKLGINFFGHPVKQKHMVSEKRHCTQRFNQDAYVQKGAYFSSVKVQFRVMGLGIQCHLRILNKCVKFQSNSTNSVWEKAMHANI